MLFFPMALNFLVLIFGVVLLCLVISWKRQRGKSLFIAFVASTFVVIPITQFLFVAILFVVDSQRGGYQLAQVMGWIDSGMLIVMFINAMVLLMMYAIARRRGDEPADSGDEFVSTTSGKFWETRIPTQELIQILRRREWAFLIDCLPAMLLGVGVLGLAAWASNNSGSRGLTGLSIFGVQLMVFVDFLLLLYIVLRDSVGGVSLGKRLTGCRVINAKNGEPADFAICLIRNLIFVVPVMAIVELAVASFRADRRRLGDLLAGTLVVTGPPKTIDGVEQVVPSSDRSGPPVKHALDD